MESIEMVTAIPSSVTANPAPFSVTAASVLESIQESIQDQPHHPFDAVMALARTLQPFSGNMLELHFDRKEAPFDFAYRINKDYDAPLLHAHLPETILPFLENEELQLWDPMRRFRYGIENICMEYDFPFGLPPALFFDLHRDKAFDPDTAYGDLKKLASYFQQPIYEELTGFFTNIKKLGLHVVYFGFMRSRKGASVRFTIEGLHLDNLMEIIAALEWQGDYEALSKLQQTYLHADQRLVLCMDFDRQLGHKLGLEVHTPAWKLLLEKLAANGLCNETQYIFLQRWYGKTVLSSPLSKVLTSLHQRAITCVYQRINHFKFTIESGAINTKAYLYYCF